VTNSRNTAQRVEHFNGVSARPLYHPPPLAGHLRSGAYGDYMLVVARLEPLKRIDLVLRALARVSSQVRLVIVGDGSQRMALEGTAAAMNVGHRVTFAGPLWGEPVADLYAGALGVVYAPFDEDYGYVTLESFLAGKPMITTTDAGGPLEFVRDAVASDELTETVRDIPLSFNPERREYGWRTVTRESRVIVQTPYGSEAVNPSAPGTVDEQGFMRLVEEF